LISHHADGLSYQALARHRATVGASEMQHYSPVQPYNTHPEVAVEELFAAVVVEHNQSSPRTFEDETLPQRQELKTSIWFRPPPAA
jgi:hypothetical protein